MDGWMMSFHGDRKSPNNRVVGPLPNHLNGLQMGDTNHLLTERILQAGNLHIQPGERENHRLKSNYL